MGHMKVLFFLNVLYVLIDTKKKLRRPRVNMSYSSLELVVTINSEYYCCYKGGYPPKNQQHGYNSSYN